MISISELSERMIRFSEGSLSDIQHFLKVWSFARTIGELEKIPSDKMYILEAAALLHDIGCPLCREKYGSTAGPLQEKEGALLAEEFLQAADMPAEWKDRVCYLVGHHHTLSPIDGPDYRILLEADFLVNAAECTYSADMIQDAEKRIFKTAAGQRLLHSMFTNLGD